jgi:hypothetical protein
MHVSVVKTQYFSHVPKGNFKSKRFSFKLSIPFTYCLAVTINLVPTKDHKIAWVENFSILYNLTI